MIIPNGASGRLVLASIIPMTAFVGSLSVVLQNNRKFRGVAASFSLSAVLGGGQLRMRIESNNGISANSILITAYTTAILSQTHTIYPGCTYGSGVTHYAGTLPETFRVFLENISAVPGNEVTANLSLTLLE